ncbi:MAG: hypothetical protein MJ209_04265 [archaeon]|nr:hypothetical protein [archaeon]
MYYKNGDGVTAYLYVGDTPLTGATVTIMTNNNKYDVVTDSTGKAFFKVDLSAVNMLLM